MKGLSHMNILSELGCVVLTTLLSIITLFLLAKLIGNRQMAQLSLFDYVNGITIGSIAAELATDLENWHKTLLALVIYGLLTFFIAYLDDKCLPIQRFIDGKAYVIYQNNKIYEKNLAKAHLNMDEFLRLCRIQGYFDLQDIHTAILESNGQLSVLPKATKRPTNPEDFGMNPTQDFPVASVVLDGTILYRNLKQTGNDEKWLMKQLHAKGAKDIKQVMYASCSFDNKVEVYLKTNEKHDEDIFK